MSQSWETDSALFFLSLVLPHHWPFNICWCSSEWWETNMFLTVELLSKNSRNTQQETFQSTTVDFCYFPDVRKQIHELKACMYKSQAHPHSTQVMKGSHWLPLHHLHGLFSPMGYKLFLLLKIMIILGTKRLKMYLSCGWKMETTSYTIDLLAEVRHLKLIL